MSYRYIIILDTLLNNSDLFVYDYVFKTIGLLNYKIVNDIEIIKSKLTEDNIIIMNWSSSINYCYLNNNKLIINPLNYKVINGIRKKYILLCGDTLITDKIKIPIYEYEYANNVIFNFI